MSANALTRARRSLEGLSIGDAFGETLFGDPEVVAKRAAARQLSTRRPWRWTDDTAMALSIVEILGHHDAIDPDALAAAFVRRYVAEPDRGYGQGAAALLTRVAYGVPWRREASRLFDGQGSYGNGAAMRAAPIGAYFATDLERTRAEASRSAEPTHAHPEGEAGAIAVAIAAALVASGTAGHTLIDHVIPHVPDGETRTRLGRAAKLSRDTEPADAGSMLGTGRDVAAYDTVPFCLWIAARHLDSYEDALWAACSQLGDRDTMGAIIGGIVALAPGAQIPPAWRAAAEVLPDPLA